jgi:hypothetical protein
VHCSAKVHSLELKGTIEKAEGPTGKEVPLSKSTAKFQNADRALKCRSNVESVAERESGGINNDTPLERGNYRVEALTGVAGDNTAKGPRGAGAAPRMNRNLSPGNLPRNGD